MLELVLKNELEPHGCLRKEECTGAAGGGQRCGRAGSSVGDLVWVGVLWWQQHRKHSARREAKGRGSGP